MEGKRGKGTPLWENNIFIGFSGGEAWFTAEGVLYHDDLNFEKACNMDFEFGGFTWVFVFF